MKILKLIIISAMMLVTSNSYAQNSVDSIKTVVDNLFIAMQNSDTTLLKSCFSEGAILQTIYKKDGIVDVKTEVLTEFISSIASQAKGALDERITFDMVKVDGDLAIAWTPYSFYYKTIFSHCGVNSFQLVRINGYWKIQYLIDTRRKTGCQ